MTKRTFSSKGEGERRYRTLRKKLQELEAELHFLYSTLPPEIADSEHNRHLVASEIEQHFAFANTLLSAEINSTPPSKSTHLHRIGRKLARLESIFRNWESSTTPAEKFDSISTYSSEDGESIRKNEGELDSKEEVLPDVAVIPVEEEKKEMKVEMEEVVMEKKEKKKKKKRGILLELFRYGGVFVSGVIFGISMLDMYGSIVSAGQEGFLIPT